MGTIHAQAVGEELHIARTQVSTGNPNGVVTAGIIGELYWDSVNGIFYVAEAVNNSSWVSSSAAFDEWTDLLDTPSSISPNLSVQGNAAGTALEFGQALDITDSPTFTNLLVKDGDAGAIVASSFADTLVVEGDGDHGMAILTPDDKFGAIEFGSPSRQTGALLRWKQSIGLFNIGTADTGAEIAFSTDLGAEAVRIDSTGRMGIGTNTPDVTALLDLDSTTRGFLPPQMTTAQRDAIASPASGLQIYNTSTDDQEFFNGVSWQSMGGGDVSGPPSSNDNAVARFNGTTGKNIQNTGITISDADKLDVKAATADTDSIFALKTTGLNGALSETFVGSRDPDGNITGAGGDSYLRANARLSGSYESKELATGTTWFRRSVTPPTTHELFSSSDLDDLATAGTITITSDTTFKILGNFTSPVVLNITGGNVIISGDFNQEAEWTYSGTGTFITVSNNSNLRIKARARLLSSSTGTFIDFTGFSEAIAVTVTIDDSVIRDWNDLGTIRFAALILNFATLLSYSAPFKLIDTSTSGTGVNLLIGGRAFQITHFNPDFEIFTSLTSLFAFSMSAPPIRIDPFVANNAVLQFLNVSTGSDLIKIFDTVGITASYTAVADSSIASTPITSVSDNAGVAVFNHSGTDPFVGSRVTIIGFITNTDYNDTFFVTTVTAGSFECEDGQDVAVPFGSSETTGSFTMTGITVTSTAHGLSTGQTLVLSGDASTQYDAGYKIYNVLTNSFDVTAVFVATELGTFDTSGLDESNRNVLVEQAIHNKTSKYIACAHVNNNAVVNGAIVNNIFTDMVFGTVGLALVESTTAERTKLVNKLNGTFEYTGNEEFNGNITFDFTVESFGGTVDFRFKWQISTDGGSTFNDFAAGVESLVAVGSDAQSVTKTFPLDWNTGDQIKPQITRNSGTSDITTIYASIYASQ